MSEDKQPYAAEVKREKYWPELSIEEKIERMRWVINTRMDRLERLVRSIDQRLSRLEEHKHDERSGAIVVPLPAGMGLMHRASRPIGSTIGDKKDDEVFF